MEFAVQIDNVAVNRVIAVRMIVQLPGFLDKIGKRIVGIAVINYVGSPA